MSLSDAYGLRVALYVIDTWLKQWKGEASTTSLEMSFAVRAAVESSTFLLAGLLVVEMWPRRYRSCIRLLMIQMAALNRCMWPIYAGRDPAPKTSSRRSLWPLTVFIAMAPGH